jgi:hypothetical protein
MKNSKYRLALLCFLYCFSLSAQISDDYVTLIKVQKNDLYGYVDDQGAEVIPIVYDHLLDYHEGLVAGRKNGNWVYLNSKGDIVIDLKNRYTVCGNFHDGKAYVTTGEMLLSEYVKGRAYTNSNDIRYINRKGDEILHLDHGELGYFMEYPNSDYFSEGLLKVTIPYLPNYANTLHGYVDTTGRWVIPPLFHTQYSFEENFSEGLVVVGLHPYSQMKSEPLQRYGYVDYTGNWVIMPDFHEASSFKNGVAIVTKYSDDLIHGGMTWEQFYIDKKGKRIFHDSIETSPELQGKALGIYSESVNNKYYYALADTLGNLLTPLDMENIMQGDLWGFKRDGLYGFMNDLGEVVIGPQYYNVNGFKQGLCSVNTAYADGKYSSGVINLKNEWVMPMQDVYQYDLENGLILQFTRETRNNPSYFNREGNEIHLSEYTFKNDDIQWVKK